MSVSRSVPQGYYEPTQAESHYFGMVQSDGAMRALLPTLGLSSLHSQHQATPVPESARGLLDTMRIQDPLSGGRDGSEGPATILQFTSLIYFVEEDEGEVVIDIMRLGNQDGCVSCDYHTKDGSGKDGTRYEAVEGTLVFESGEARKSISVPIVDSDQWAATLEFKVCLDQPEGCTIGAFLHTCRVKVIDSDTFPSSKYEEVAEGMEAITTIGSMSLFLEYCKMNLGVQGIRWRTMACLVFDQFENAYLFYKLIAMAYMLNVLFHDVEKNPTFTIDQRVEQALWIGVGYIVPMGLLHAWELARARIDINGHSRVYLQQSIVRKFLNYNEESREQVTIADVQLAVREDAADLAAGYMAALSLFKLLGKLAVMLYFTLHSNPNALTTVMVMPALMLLFGRCRNSRLHTASEPQSILTVQVLAYVADMAKNYRLISNYQQRPKINEGFEKKVDALRTAEISPNSVKINNDFFTRWLGPTFIGLYIITHARALLTGQIGHGTFVATLSVFSEISATFSEGYAKMMKISSITGALYTLTEMMNRRTDLMAWKTVNRQRRENTKLARAKALQECGSEHPFPTDLIPFQFKDMCYAFPDSDTNAIHNVNLSVNQGSLVAVLGKHGQGRHTFLRLIAHEVFPVRGDIFIPTHLRILHVSQECYVLDTNILDNLTFGCNENRFDSEIVKYVLKRLDAKNLLEELLKEEKEMDATSNEDFNPDLSEEDELEDFKICQRSCSREITRMSDGAEDLEEPPCLSFNCLDGEDEKFEPPDSKWVKRLNYTDLAKLHLARALIMNPEVMVLQRPLLHFSQDQQAQILEMLREHVSNRGLGLPPESVSIRRPRTVFVSVENDEQAKQADVVWDMKDLPGATSAVAVMDRGPPTGRRV